jgi:S1-C subfamily serine protease
VGLLVQGVYKDSVAESVGFNRGDLLLYADGKPLSDIRVFRSVLQAHQDGSDLKMTIIRGRKIYELEFSLTPEGERPKKPKKTKKSKGFNIPIN